MATDPTVCETDRTAAPGRARRLTTETKSAWKTTESWIFLILAVGVLIASRVITGDNTGPDRKSADPFTSDQACLYVSILGIWAAGNRSFIGLQTHTGRVAFSEHRAQGVMSVGVRLPVRTASAGHD